jgi:hypothetical protein
LPFDVATLTGSLSSNNRYEHRLAELLRDGRSTDSIKRTVSTVIENLQEGARSFVIYGEPQSGKTEMMIALTARLLDEGRRIVIVLVNDSVQLLRQNLSRFRKAGLDPAPKHFEEILHKEISLKKGEWIVFCKKNTHDLQKLSEKLRNISGIIILDDEADYATPNAKVNVNQRTRINELVGQLLGDDGIYLGVTATPARLDLNNTFDNETERWVIFDPHPEYNGHTVFFPSKLADLERCDFQLAFLPDTNDIPKYLREALFRFFVRVAHLNLKINDIASNYCMLVHTSGVKVDHSEDHEQILKTISILGDEAHGKYEHYYKEIHEISEKNFPGEGQSICLYIRQNIGRNVVVVMNSEKKGNRGSDYETATSPMALFTIAIGGNIVSRGVTFNNLLSMFFTRDVKQKIQQDTYIQRARMFGSRGEYLKHFELSIPANLYNDWHRCFLYRLLRLRTRNVLLCGSKTVELRQLRQVASIGQMSMLTVVR